MRVVFMGTPSFAATILEALARATEHEVVGVYTQPDAVRSRGKKLDPSPVKICALEHDLDVFEYATFKDNDAIERLVALNPDVVVVAAYGVILPQAALDVPKFGCLNVHASLLPRWRGAAPIERALLAGDEEVGVCVMQMEAGLDTGDYCLKSSIPSGSLTSTELTHELARLGASILLDALARLETGTIEWSKQNEDLVTYADKIEKGELDISPSMNVEAALRNVRASSENHPSKCVIGGKVVSIISAAAPDPTSAELEGKSAGQVSFIAKRLYLSFADGSLEVLEVHPGGKKLMSGRDFAAGLQGVKQGNVTWEAHEN